MKIETLKDRIKKAEEKLVKLNGTLERHNKTLEKKANALIKLNVDLTNYDKFDRTKISSDAYYDLCDYEYKLEDIKNTEKKIRETTESLEKYNQQLKDQIAKDSETENLIPECLNIFLENWKKKAFNYFMELANKYIELNFKEYEITKEELEQFTEEHRNFKERKTEIVRKYTEEQINEILKKGTEYIWYDDIKRSINYRYFKEFKKSIFGSELAIIEKIVDYNEINSKILDKILNEEVKVKKEMFINRIKEVIGDIKDLTGLKIGNNGEINGIAKGLKANAKVETISAGGYNIQCWHFRVLVNTVK